MLRALVGPFGLIALHLTLAHVAVIHPLTHVLFVHLHHPVVIHAFVFHHLAVLPVWLMELRAVLRRRGVIPVMVVVFNLRLSGS